VSAINHGRAWDREQSMRLVYASRAFQALHGYTYPTVKALADYMGRTENSILCRMYVMLGDRSLTYSDNLLNLFRQFDFSEYNDMNDTIDPTKGPAKYRIVMDNKTKNVADTAEEAEAKATALLRLNPTKDVFVFTATKRFFVPANISSEDVA
jgi:hypothetical protein